MALFTLVVIAAVIVLNLIVGKLPAKYLKHDLSSNKILTLGDTTRDILAQLDRDVTIHIVADPNSVDERITSFVNLYKDLSPHISVEANDPVLHPDVLASLDTEPGNLIVSYESTGKKHPFHLTISSSLTPWFTTSTGKSRKPPLTVKDRLPAPSAMSQAIQRRPYIPWPDTGKPPSRQPSQMPWINPA